MGNEVNQSPGMNEREGVADRLPTHGKLLADINKAAHAAGTNAWVRDVLQRAHRAIRQNAPLAAPAQSAWQPIRDAALEEAAKIAENGCLVPPDGGSPTEDEREMCEGIASAIRVRKLFPLPSSDRGGAG